MKIKLTKVTPTYRANTARAAYYEAITKYDGKPLAEFVKAVTAKPPSYPQRGKLAGKQEPVQGWVGFFTREGVIELTDK